MERGFGPFSHLLRETINKENAMFSTIIRLASAYIIIRAVYETGKEDAYKQLGYDSKTGEKLFRPNN